MQDQINLIQRIREVYKTVEKNKINLATYKRALDAIFRAITNYTKVKYVSKAAKAKATKLGIDLVNMTWDNQNKQDPKRTNFKYEHCIPVNTLITRVLETDEDVKNIIKDNFVCWVLVEEDDELEKHHYRKKRPGGWKKCYKECGIEPILNK